MSSRSTSPATPNERDDAFHDALTPAIADVDLADWCHSFSPNTRTMSLPWHDGSVKPDYAADAAMSGPTFSLSTCSPPSTTAPSPLALMQPFAMDLPYPSPPLSKPIPPPPSSVRKREILVEHKVVRPPKQDCYDLRILAPGIPASGTKSRVETQVRVQIDLANVNSTIADVGEYDKVGSWDWLKLPPGSATRKRSRKEGRIDATPKDILNLRVEVTCASPPHTHVTSCSGCQNREAKRVARKIAARVRPQQLSDSDSDSKSGQQSHEDTSSIVTFNCPDMLSFSEGSAVLPLRITCYCRHHREKVGFLVHFSMTDNSGRLVGRGITPPIMITDDHKSTHTTAKLNPALHAAVGAQTDQDLPPSPEDVGAPSKRKAGLRITRAKHRQKPYDTARKVDGGAGMVSPSEGALHTLTDSGYSPNSMSSLYTGTTAPSSPDISDDQPSSGVSHIPMELGYPPSDSTFIQLGLDPSITLDPVDMFVSHQPQVRNLTSPHLADTRSVSYLPTAPPSPPVQMHSLDPLSQGPTLYSFFPPPPPPLSDVLPLPRIHRLIPASGPTFGGVEITILGAHFHAAMPLKCTFGDIVASSTLRWSDNTLVCVLPPRAVPGVVAVGIEGVKDDQGSPPVLFTYTDESDKALMELALQVVGLKMTGKVEDAKSVAMRIVNTAEPSQTSTSPAMQGTILHLANASASPSFDPRQLLLSRVNDGHFEECIIDFLRLLNLDMVTPTTRISAISQPTASGQTLLHLAVILNFEKLVMFLIENGIDLDARDRNGLTALHVAAICRHKFIAALLVEIGADREVVDAHGQTAQEMAPLEFFAQLVVCMEAEDSAIDADEETDSVSAEEDEEAGWGDVEDSSSNVLRRRGNGRSHVGLKRVQVPYAEPSDSLADEKAREDEKEKELFEQMDEKQAAASFVESIQRAFAQWHYPQGIIPNIPTLPMPHLPGMPAVQWGALPQVPMVFPVFVPMRTWQTVFGERRPDSGDESGLDSNIKAGSSSHPAPPPKKKWMDRMPSILSTHKEDNEPAPPPYTPLAAFKSSESSVTAKDELGGPSTVEITPTLASQRALLRRFGYGSSQVTDQEINAYGYRPGSQQKTKLLKKQDRMLVLFWIPILILACLYVIYICVPSLVAAVKLVLPSSRQTTTHPPLGVNVAIHVQ